MAHKTFPYGIQSEKSTTPATFGSAQKLIFPFAVKKVLAVLNHMAAVIFEFFLPDSLGLFFLQQVFMFFLFA